MLDGAGGRAGAAACGIGYATVSAAGLNREEARSLPGSEARLIWEQTTVPQSGLAERLGMGRAAKVSQQLRRQASAVGKKLPRALRDGFSRSRNAD